MTSQHDHVDRCPTCGQCRTRDSETRPVHPLIVRLYAALGAAGAVWFAPRLLGWQGVQSVLVAMFVIGLAWVVRRAL